jgi:hypothetical protein
LTAKTSALRQQTDKRLKNDWEMKTDEYTYMWEATLLTSVGALSTAKKCFEGQRVDVRQYGCSVSDLGTSSLMSVSYSSLPGLL